MAKPSAIEVFLHLKAISAVEWHSRVAPQRFRSGIARAMPRDIVWGKPKALRGLFERPPRS